MSIRTLEVEDGILVYSGLPSGSSTRSTTPGSMGHSLHSKVKELERKLGRIELENRVLWELVRDALKLSDEQMDVRFREVDRRDGREDGKVTTVPLRCPSCKRVSSSKNWKCLYCGMEFEKYVY